MPFDPSAPFEIIEAPPRFDPSKPFEIVDSPQPAVSTSEGLKSSLERGWLALKNVPDTIALAAKSDLGESGAVRYAADRGSRAQVMDALLAAGQDPAAQTEAYFRTGPEAVIRQRQAEIAKPVIERMAASEALPRSEAQQRLQTAKGASEKFKTWARDPVELTASIILESLPASLAGAAVGSLGGPPGMIAGVGLSSGLSTFSSELFGNAASHGVDIQNTDAVVNWLNSPQFDEDFKAAATKSAVVGVIDSATAGRAGSFISPAIKQGLKKAAVASGKEVALQAAGGASGEALGSVAAGQPVDPFNVFVEAIAEVGSAPGEVAGNLRKSVRGGLRGKESILRRGVPVAETPKVEPVKNLPDWARAEMESRGLDPKRPLNDIDVQNPSVRNAVESDPTLTPEQKSNILATGSPKPPAIATPVPESEVPKPREPWQMTPEEAVQAGIDFPTYQRSRDDALRSERMSEAEYKKHAFEARPDVTPANWPSYTIGQRVWADHFRLPGTVSELGIGKVKVRFAGGKEGWQSIGTVADLRAYAERKLKRGDSVPDAVLEEFPELKQPAVNAPKAPTPIPAPTSPTVPLADAGSNVPLGTTAGVAEVGVAEVPKEVMDQYRAETAKAADEMVREEVDKIKVSDIKGYERYTAEALTNLIRRAGRWPALRPALQLAFEKVGKAAREQGADVNVIRQNIGEELKMAFGDDAPEMAEFYFGANKKIPKIAETKTPELPAESGRVAAPSTPADQQPRGKSVAAKSPLAQPESAGATITGANERRGSGMPAEPDYPQGPSGPQRSSRKSERPPDIIDDIEAHYGGKLNLPAARKLIEGYRPTGAARRLYSAAGKGFPDDVLSNLHAQGLHLNIQTDGQLIEAIEAAANTRKNSRTGATREKNILAEEEKQTLEFEKTQNTSPPRSPQTIDTSTLIEGDEFTLKGEKVTVKEVEIDEDGNATFVVLEDGRRFGTQTVTASKALNIDKGSLKEAPRSKDFVSDELLGKETPFNLAGEKIAAVEEAPPAPSEFGGFGDDRLAQSEMFAIQKIVEHKDPAKSADAAQQLYGGAREAARKIQAQLDVLDSMPKADALKAFNKEQRARLKEVVALLRERATTKPTLLEFAKSKLPKDVADKITDESQVESYRAQWEKEFGGKSFRETAESIAEKLEGIKSGRKPGDLQLFGVIPAVWDAAVGIAQGIIRAGGTAADAIAAALAHIRANNAEPFEEQKATAFLEGVVKPQTQFTEPDENEAEPAGEQQTGNIAGRTYPVISKDKLTAEQRAAADKRAQEKFAELGIPGVPDTTDDTRRGSTNNNTVFRVVPDGQNHDAAVRALREHLIEQIQIQHSREGDMAYVGSLVNAINMNFDLVRWDDVVSQPVLESLLEVSVGESSKSGTMLRRFRGISDDIRAVAGNAALRLKWEYAQALDPEGYAKGALTRVLEGIRKFLTEAEITSLALKLVKPDEAAPVIAALRKAIAGEFTSMSDVMKAAQAALMDAGMTEPQARKIVSEAETILSQTIRDGANAAIAQMKSELTPEKKRGAAGRALNEIQKMLLNDIFSYSDLLTRLAKGERWVVPTAKEFEQMRKWAKDEEAMRTPSADEIARHGSVETATEMVSAATLDARRKLLAQMKSQWSQWTNPLITNWRDLGDPIKVRNTNMAFNEWVAANLLLKIGFGTRQVWDIASQMALNTPTRAVSYAFESWQNDKAAGRDSSLQHSISEAITDAYRARIKVLVPALNAFKETLAGRGEQKKQVEQLISSIGIFDRALLNTSQMRAEGKRGAANLLEIIALTTRMGRQFAAAMDVLQGIPAETQEIAHQVRNGLREKGLTGKELEIQYDSIIGLLSTYRAEAISLGRETLEAKGVEATRGAVERAAWHILREKLYHAAAQAGLKTDDWKKNNEVYRDLLGWNLPETGGTRGRIGGFGGLVSLGGRAAKDMLAEIPLVGGVMAVPFTFANAMGISLNRKLAWSPLGFFPGIFKGSPHWEGETNIRQRKIEAVLGTGISATVFSLIVAGVWKALPAFWPKDEKERERWVKNGWQPGMVLIPWGNGQELHISTRVGPLAFFSPAIAAAAAYTKKVEDRAKKQAVSDARAKKMGVKPEQLPDLSAADWMGIMIAAGYSSLTGGRTASGAMAAYSDYGTFNIKKAAASITGAVLPGFPALNEFGRMAGANINPKLASFWDMLVPMPTSDAQRVNVLGDPMRDENDYRRVFQILSGGNFPFPTSATPAETQAYAALFESEYRPPAINPGRGYNIGGRYRPFTPDELSKYTAARGQAFKRELGALGASPTDAQIKAAFVQANDSALASVGVAVPVRSTRTTGRRTRSTSRFRLGRTRRGRSLRLGRRGLRGMRKRRKRLVLR